MKIKTTITNAQTIEFSEREILTIVLKHVINELGQDWEFSLRSINQRRVPAYMGQIDDEYETTAKFELIKETVNE